MGSLRKAAILLACLALPVLSSAQAGKPSVRKAPVRTASQQPPTTAIRRAVNAKPLGIAVKRGLAWLAASQQRSGGWSQGEESAAMGSTLAALKDTPNVADTCIAALALMRAGSTPKSGPYARNLVSALKFVCAEIEESPRKGLSITSVNGTRVQMKLGRFIDTFLAALLLAEVKGHLPDLKLEKRVASALSKVVAKMENAQRNDGTWDDQGWAPVIGQNFAAKALNRAAQQGAKVDASVLRRAEGYSLRQFDQASGSFGGGGSAGVQLYAATANLGAMQQSEITNRAAEARARATVKSGKTEKDRRAASATLRRIEAGRQGYKAAQQAVIEKLDDKSFVAGFGSNGGEEFLSYNTIGESLVEKGGQEWTKWDRKITASLERVQNNDGTWTGHHCITGRTFCTAAALLVLTVDRASVALGDATKRR